MYAEKTMIVTKTEEEELRVVERKGIRLKMGPAKVNQNEHRRTTNNDICYVGLRTRK